MGLQLILGNSGAGKSHYIFQKIIEESMQQPGKQFLVIVPEQFTMQTQKDLVMMHPRHGIMNIDVLSFERLAHRVFDETGAEHRRVLEDTGKNLILRRLAEEKKEELTLLGGNLKKLGYISELKSLISEFTQYRIQPEQLEQMMEQNLQNPQLYYKLKDLKVIYDSFRSYLENTYLTAEELLEALEKTVEQSKIVKGSVLVLDGYTGFTPVQMHLLRRLLYLAEEVYVTLTMDGNEKPFEMDAEYQLFHMTKRTIAGLTRLAEESRVEVRPPVIFSDAGNKRYRNAPALQFLENHIFRHGKEFWGDATEEVQLYTMRTPRAEAETIGREIQRLVRDQGYRYRDMAVVTGNPEVYGPLMEQVFSQFEIPGFIDQKKDVLKNPFIEFLRALTACIQEDLSYEAVFRLLRSGMAGILPEETDLLENYVIARGIRGISGWKKEWKYPLKGMTEEELEELNHYREKAIGGLEELWRELKAKDADAMGMTRAVYTYLTGKRIQEQLKAYEVQFNASGDYGMSREYAQIYGMVMELFDKIVMLLGDCRMDLEEYAQLLDAGFSEMKVGLIPAGTDQVLVGDMERSRLKDIQILFFAGVNEGSVPKAKDRGGILSEMERELLLEQEVELAPTSRQEAYIQKFYIYLNLTKPSERLYLSWSQTDMDGNPLRPSFLISHVQQLFPNAAVCTGAEGGFLNQLVHPGGNIKELTEALKAWKSQEAQPAQKALIQWYEDQKLWRDRLEQLIDAVYFERHEDQLGKAVARALYGTLLEGSVTRLEQFAACSYAHFLKYGLQLTERETYGLEAVDMGNVFHSALKYFSDAVDSSEFDWLHVPDENRIRWMEQALEQAMEDYAQKILSDRASDRYTMERIRRISQRTAWAVLRQLEKGAFFPEETEVSFRGLEQLQSVSVLLSEDERMRLSGRIDRIDVCRRNGNVYVRVIDYKSGSTRFDLTSIYYGLQLQLVVYLNAAVELERRKEQGEVEPAGMFYYHIEDPFLEYQEDEDPRQRLLRELALNGLVNSDREIVSLMDHAMTDSSDILPVKLKKDGNFTAASSVASSEQFEAVSRHVQKKLAEYGERILKGDIGLSPYELGDEDACRYCSYHSVCGFDRKVDGCEKRRLTPMTKDEIWQRLKEEEA